MHLFNKTPFFLAAAIAVSAIPLDESSTLHRLVSRGAQYDTSCDRKIPGSDKTYKEKAQTALGDAGKLAQNTQNGKDLKGNAFTESTAFSHYFGDGDKDTVKTMMQVIYNERIPSDANHAGEGYNFAILCGDDKDDECGPSVLAATSANPKISSMVLCDRFFSSNTAQTKQDLNTKVFAPDKPRQRGQWCTENEQFPFFEVAGLTIFHEMSHLHIVGHNAGLPVREDPDGFTSEGTEDVYVQGGDSDRDHYKNMEPWQAAREVKKLWDTYNGDNTKYKPTTPTTENAESYAAAALEFYFLSNCKWDVILPK
ncbi:hypothetical protein HYFRA_00014104 [Hymenoscyphus fraxineus]|uniref:Lysine-specific metallo-endopeptidase domain-containing protein n=1 Tax=Hymenoscyphus fraxineus TaxID=746836 RepID=A0A9N9LBI0_9HELO|nr:hypothetical protein HYFRA_00014104 [Hymenoscyphus fraxineus]